MIREARMPRRWPFWKGALLFLPLAFGLTPEVSASQVSGGFVERAREAARQGRFRDAETVLHDAFALGAETRNSRLQGVASMELAHLAVTRADYDEAENQLDMAFLAFRQAEQYGDAVGALLVSYDVWLHFEDSAHDPGRALEPILAWVGKDDPAVAAGLPRALAVWNRFHLAPAPPLEFRAKLLEVLQSPPLEAAGEARFGLGAAVLHLFGEDDDPKEQEALARRAVAAAEAARSGTDEARARAALGAALFLQGRHDQALPELETALGLVRKAGNAPEVEGLVLAVEAKLHATDGEIRLAEELLGQAAERFEEILDDALVDEMLGLYHGGNRQRLYAEWVEVLAAAGRTDEAFRWTEQARARTLLGLLGAQRLTSRGDASLAAQADALRATILDRERRLVFATGNAAESLRQELKQDRQGYRELLGRLRSSDPGYSAVAGAEPVSLADAQAALEPSTTLVSYFTTPHRGFAWVLDRNSVEWIDLGMSTRDVDNFKVRCFAEGIATGPWDPRRWKADSGCQHPITPEDLYGWLFAPLRPFVRGRKLIVVPHGDLQHASFGALRNPRSRRYLVEDYLLSVLPSAGALRWLRSAPAPTPGPALVLGKSMTENWFLEELAEAPVVSRAAAAALGTEAWLEAEATEDRFRENAAQAGTIHLDAHGIYLPEYPASSYVDLAGSEGHDGHLTLTEVLGLDLPQTELVTLAVGRTISGELTGGDQNAALASAFLYAGSRAVLGKLRRIQGVEEAFLLLDVYQRAQAGMAAAQALRESQLRALDRTGRETPGPWAVWVVYGIPEGAAPAEIPAEEPSGEPPTPAPSFPPDDAAYRLLRARDLADASAESLAGGPQRSLLLAVEALRQAGDAAALVPSAQSALRSALASTSGLGLPRKPGSWSGLATQSGGALRGPSPEVAVAARPGRVDAIAWDAAGRFLAFGGRDGAVDLWQLGAGEPPVREVASWRLPEGVASLGLSASGRWLAVGGIEGGVRLLHLKARSSEAIVLRQGGSQYVSSHFVDEVLFSEDGTRLLAHCAGEVFEWKLAPEVRRSRVYAPEEPNPLGDRRRRHAALLGRLRLDSSEMDTSVVAADRSWLATGGLDGRPHLWSLVSPEDPQEVVLESHQGMATAVAFSADSRWLASGGTDQIVRLWDLRPESHAPEGRVLRGADAGITVLAFSPDGRWLVAGTDGYAPRLWDLHRLEDTEPRVLSDGTRILTARFLLDGRWLATGDLHGRVRLWDLQSDTTAGPVLFPGDGQRVLGYAVSVSADGRWLAMPFGSSELRLWDFSTVAEPRLAIELDIVEEHALDRQGRWLAVTSPGGALTLYDLRTTDLPPKGRLLADYGQPMKPLLFHPTGRFLVAGDRLWRFDGEAWEEARLSAADGPPSLDGATFSDDGALLTAYSGAGEMCLYRFDGTADLGKSIRLSGARGLVYPVFSGDSRWLATGGQEARSTRLWPLTAEDPRLGVRDLQRHQGQILKLAASGDGHWLATAALDATPYLWDLQGPDPAMSGVLLPGHKLAPVLSEDGLFGFPDLAFSADSRRLATVGLDGTVRIWELDPARLIRRACRVAGRNLSAEEWERYVLPRTPYACTCPSLPPGPGGPERCPP